MGELRRNHRARWSRKDVRRLARMRKRGRSVLRIALALRRTPDAVSMKLSRMGLGSEPPAEWTRKEMRRMVKMRDAGMSLAVVARRLGRSYHACQTKLRRMRRQAMAA